MDDFRNFRATSAFAVRGCSRSGREIVGLCVVADVGAPLPSYEDLVAENEQLRALVAKLETRVVEPERRLGQNSGNSGLPSSRDPAAESPDGCLPTGRRSRAGGGPQRLSRSRVGRSFGYRGRRWHWPCSTLMRRCVCHHHRAGRVDHAAYGRERLKPPIQGTGIARGSGRPRCPTPDRGPRQVGRRRADPGTPRLRTGGRSTTSGHTLRGDGRDSSTPVPGARLREVSTPLGSHTCRPQMRRVESRR